MFFIKKGSSRIRPARNKMQYFKFIIIVLSVYVLIPQTRIIARICSPTANDCTQLTLKATDLKMNMTKQQVIALLGKPTWVILPQDKDLGSYDIPLNLMWENGECSPVSVNFNMQALVTGWDQGRLCYKKAKDRGPNLADKYKCTNKDRAVFCKKTIGPMKSNFAKYKAQEAKQIPESVTDGQAWVIGNISVGTEWDYSFWKKKFGKSIELQVGDEWNPDIIKDYYFKSIDMSVFVNTLEGKISTWRIGKKTY